MPRHIAATEYSPAWRAEFEKGAALIKEVLGENCIALYHIGSTAVPGLKAKPIIGMMPPVSPQGRGRADPSDPHFQDVRQGGH